MRIREHTRRGDAPPIWSRRWSRRSRNDRCRSTWASAAYVVVQRDAFVFDGSSRPRPREVSVSRGREAKKKTQRRARARWWAATIARGSPRFWQENRSISAHARCARLVRAARVIYRRSPRGCRTGQEEEDEKLFVPGGLRWHERKLRLMFTHE